MQAVMDNSLEHLGFLVKIGIRRYAEDNFYLDGWGVNNVLPY